MMYASRTLFAEGSIRVKDAACARSITLDRPASLNALTLMMMRRLHTIYLHEPHASEDAVYVLRGAGTRSFCAGGDVQRLTGAGPAYTSEYYYREYQVCHHIANMQRRQVALWNGHVLGSGVGLSLHSKHRVACGNTSFAMPEAVIGAAPDVGATYVFHTMRLRCVGAYMAITGNHLRGADVVHVGLATHFVPSEKLDALETALMEMRRPSECEACLADFSDAHTLPPFTLSHHLPLLQRAFDIHEDTSLQDILDVLESDGGAFARMIVETMRNNSPLGMGLALESFKRQRTFATRAASIAADYNLANHMNDSHDFCEGVRAVVVEKTRDAAWNPPTIAQLRAEDIRKYFEPAAIPFDPRRPYEEVHP